MTKESIVNNGRRLLNFLCEKDFSDDSLLRFGVSCEGLLRVYGNIMDYNGAGVDQYSRLYLPEHDYSELKEFAKDKPEYIDLFVYNLQQEELKKQVWPNHISAPKEIFKFQYEGYRWIIFNLKTL